MTRQVHSSQDGSVGDGVFASAHFGDHESLTGKSLAIPYLLEDPSDALRATASLLIRQFVRPRRYIRDKVERFYNEKLVVRDAIGVHIRGTDAASVEEKRSTGRTRCGTTGYREEVYLLLEKLPDALVFVATDAERVLALHALGIRRPGSGLREPSPRWRACRRGGTNWLDYARVHRR